MEKEEWRPVKGYEGLYEVSNRGRLRSFSHTIHFVRCGVPSKRIVVGQVYKPFFSDKGYYRQIMSKNGESKNLYVHRLVAEAFIPNPHNLPEVNHKNSKRCDNRIENLEWVTKKENIYHGLIFGKTKFILGRNKDGSIKYSQKNYLSTALH